ncbi:hypothetical protein [Pseudoflavonifractor sp. An187]|uniref:hypothetical protein n=1 Tax=Pseudoflavonifractor sp. An187 TaxID=1965578 RepID=UPI000B3A6F8E|nr:hypothetical protein [Pseudoflavonifractor sp. An187]OUP45778.1 hypothetical protein B5F22_03230 [Pseudoflavonifractor sp. An187]
MKYTMTCKKNTITIDTKTGDIYGDTYAMKEIIKSDLYATWDNVRKVWHSDNLDETINEFRQYLTRCYKLEVVDAEELSEEADDSSEAKATTETVKTAEAHANKTVSHTRLVNGNDGFYQIIYYTDGTSKKMFVG